MFSLQKFFGKDPRFFELFDRGAEEAKIGVRALQSVLEGAPITTAVQQLRDARRRSKELTEELQELVIKTFVTSLEREDIEQLSGALYKVLKPIEKFVERFRISGAYVSAQDFTGQAAALANATDRVADMVKLIRKSGNLEIARRLYTGLQQAEADADALEVELLQELYGNSTTDARRIFVAKDLYDLLEKAIDRCRDVGNVVMHITLKNS